MKKIFIPIIFSTFLFPDGISGVSYFEFSDNKFSLSRTYFTYKNTISDDLLVTFQTDVGQAGDDRLSTYLKKAQLDWKASENMKLSMGLIGLNMFNVQEKTWGNRFVAKSALDANKWSSSADLGFSLTSDAINLFTTSLMITNGEGFKTTSNVDENYKISLQLLHGEKRLDKNDGYNVGIVYSQLSSDAMDAYSTSTWNGECTTSDIDAGDCVDGDIGWWMTETIEATSENHTIVSGIFGGWSKNNLGLGTEFYYKLTKEDNDDVKSLLSSIYASYTLSDKFAIFVRKDIVDIDVEDPDFTGEETNNLIAGFEWTPTKGLSIGPNILQEGEEETCSLNFQFIF